MAKNTFEQAAAPLPRPAKAPTSSLSPEGAGARGELRHPAGEPDLQASTLDILHLAELVPIVRARFGLGDGFADDAILSSLRVIAANSDERQRWLAAFNSNLGRSLASEGHDLNTALSALIALVPRPTS